MDPASVRHHHGEADARHHEAGAADEHHDLQEAQDRWRKTSRVARCHGLDASAAVTHTRAVDGATNAGLIVAPIADGYLLSAVGLKGFPVEEKGAFFVFFFFMALNGWMGLWS